MPSPRQIALGPFLIAALTLGCGESFFEPVAARPLQPPDIYVEWWMEVQSCTGASATFAGALARLWPELFAEIAVAAWA